MARPESRYVCDNCGAESLRWEGQCRSCGLWNTLVETPVSQLRGRARQSAKRALALPDAEPLSGGARGGAQRQRSGIGELDRVLGGGLVAGSINLLGGAPGIGKSTLMLALAAGIAAADASRPVLYASGEESLDQLRLRAERLGLGAASADQIAIISETGVQAIAGVAERIGPSLLIVDSVQTMTSDELEGPAGSVGQVRASAAVLQEYAKRSGVPVVMVGHVTKDGSLAGPKTLEHLVDVVLTLDGERFAGYRLLRAAKNRYGSTEEVGVFEMAADGLRGGRPRHSLRRIDVPRRARRGRRRDVGGQPAAAGRGPGTGRADYLARTAPNSRRVGWTAAGVAVGGPQPARRHRPVRS